MTRRNFERVLQLFLNREPFRPFTLELESGSRVEINHPEALTQYDNLIVCNSTRQMRSAFDCESVTRFIDATGI